MTSTPALPSPVELRRAQKAREGRRLDWPGEPGWLNDKKGASDGPIGPKDRHCYDRTAELTSILCPDCGHPLTSHHALGELAQALEASVADLHRARDVGALTTCADGSSVSCVAAAAFADRLQGRAVAAEQDGLFGGQVPGFAEILQAAIERGDWTAAELAERASVTADTVQSWLKPGGPLPKRRETRRMLVDLVTARHRDDHQLTQPRTQERAPKSNSERLAEAKRVMDEHRAAVQTQPSFQVFDRSCGEALSRACGRAISHA